VKTYTLTVTNRFPRLQGDGLASDESVVHCRLTIPCAPDRLLAEMITAAQRLGIAEHAAVGRVFDDITGEQVGGDTLDIAGLRKAVAGMLSPAERLANDFDDLARDSGGHFGAFAREQKPYRLTEEYTADAILDELQAHFKVSRFEVFEALKVLAERKGGIYITVYETRPQIACHISADRLRGAYKVAGPESESEDADSDKPERPVEDVK